MSLIERARVFCIAAHEAVGQRRKYSDAPYWHHPEHVVRILQQFSTHPVSDEMIAAGYLHDVVEDTNVSLETIRDLFGNNVYHLVENLTDISRPEDGPRRVRKAIDLEHTRLSSPEAKSIKCADLISNAPSITENDPGFARVWLAEKANLLVALEGADAGVLARAYEVYNECKVKIFKS